MNVLGIDPGTVRMGYGVVGQVSQSAPLLEAADYGVISLPAGMPLEQRLYQLHTHVLNLIAIFHPEAVAVEQPFVGRGERSFPGSSLAPAQVKRAVADYGAATKEQMRNIVAATLGLTPAPESDAADALAVGLCHLVQEQARTALNMEIPPGRER